MARKVGPLPLWAWSALLLAVIAYWIVRSRKAATGAIDPTALGDIPGATPSAGGGGSGSGADPLPPVVLGPGEGVYDPTTGHLTTNPDPYAPKPTTPPATTAPVASPTIPGGGGPTWTLPRINLPPVKPGKLHAIIAPIVNRGGPAAIPALIGAAVPVVPATNRTPSPPPANTSHPSFDWGGRKWGKGDQASFTSYLKAHGSNYSAWAKSHPGAAAML